MGIGKVGIVFFSKNGATKQVAETIAEGINTQQPNSVLLVEVLSSEVVEGRYDNDDKLKSLDNLGLNRTGSSIGLVASEDEMADSTSNHINSNDLQTAFYFGQRIASLVKRT
ncbi:flavodoxin family protein [Vibrio crassostreae]|uniref:flavodoxin family protein n=1 Tax=Vibrio crassostreae TaxID=246167 RepID=UPI000F48FCA3|nr:flavodoxin family protein [Vibrio crassostreae]ROP15246.1 hypothetical protein EDB33_11274 [Vibrio crassostreae]ROP20376.1 hypothetical protein EDB34_11284 [Vibrio crassostreae]RPE92093.1 hypothetical protein EDB15_11285 [Vibrio crassostreae]RPF01143.1 hypothetical protein EDB14_3634 [Vibrio crassostreae]TCN72383.1 hypothetical protein EDB60_10484 [Vibrio crassostreae]